MQGLDLGTFPGKLVPAAFLDHPCDVEGDDEVSQTCEIWGGKQAVQKSEIIHVIPTDRVSRREKEFLCNKRGPVIETA